MNEDPFSSFGTDPSSSFGTNSFDNSINNSSNDMINDAHAFASSMMTGFPIDNSSAAITGAMMHTNNNIMDDSSIFGNNVRMKNTKFCKHCGTRINITASYCKNCGVKL